MGFFNDDFFGGGIDDLFNRLTGEGFTEVTSVGPDGKKRIIRRGGNFSGNKYLLDKIETRKRIYFIFDFSGKENVKAEVKDEFTENSYGEKVSTGNKILEISDNTEKIAEFQLNGKMKTKNYESKFNNGILEVIFRK